MSLKKCVAWVWHHENGSALAFDCIILDQFKSSYEHDNNVGWSSTKKCSTDKENLSCDKTILRYHAFQNIPAQNRLLSKIVETWQECAYNCRKEKNCTAWQWRVGFKDRKNPTNFDPTQNLDKYECILFNMNIDDLDSEVHIVRDFRSVIMIKCDEGNSYDSKDCITSELGYCNYPFSFITDKGKNVTKYSGCTQEAARNSIQFDSKNMKKVNFAWCLAGSSRRDTRRLPAACEETKYCRGK